MNIYKDIVKKLKISAPKANYLYTLQSRQDYNRRGNLEQSLCQSRCFAVAST